jgi:hypothetical protein
MAKISLAGIKKNALWIGGGLAILVGGVCWYVATGRLTTAYRQNKQTVDGKFKAIDDRIKNEQNRSDKSIDGVKRDISDAYQRVKKTWEELYQRQAEHVFVWPEGLKKDFRDTIKALEDKRVKWLADKAAGKVSGDPPSEELPERLREDYQNFVRGEFRRLLQTIDATSGEDTAAGGVRWRDADRIEQTFNSRQTPSSTWIRLRQEDLWVYNAFCQVIQAVNKGVTGRTSAPIKIIDTLEIGEAAARSAPQQVGQRRLKRVHSGTTTDLGGTSTQTAPAGSGSGTADDQLKDKRYLDLKWKPIPAGELATASPPEFKLIPFRLLVYMDQRDIDRMLLEFRGSILPIEVKEMRINASVGSAAFGERDSGSVYHIPVEFRGVVYIYNPPSLKKPEFVKDTETAVAAVSATGSPVAESPAPETSTPDSPAAESPPAQTPAAGPPAAEQPAAEKPAMPAESKFISQSDGKLKIKTADNQEQEFELAENLQVTIDGAEAKLDDLKPDMTVEIVRENEKVVAIHAKIVPLETPTPTP